MVGRTTEVAEKIKETFNHDLEKYRSNLQMEMQLQTQVIAAKLQAYRKLWAETGAVKGALKGRLISDDRTRLETKLTSWYYEEGNAIFLSIRMGQLFRDARNAVTNEDTSPKDVWDSITALRTQIKVELKIYSPEEAWTELGS